MLQMRTIACIAVSLLAGCTTTHRYPVHGVARSSKEYKIRGQKYRPQQFYDYNKTGLASWYGPGFHGQKKAQGEIYDQYAMTAAHKTLPLPSIVKVTNMATGKSIIVLVDDRGPYVDNRIIDLSFSAAKALGTYERGVTKVRVQSLCKESDAFAVHLSKNAESLECKNMTWEDIYRKRIGGSPGYRQLTVVANHGPVGAQNQPVVKNDPVIKSGSVRTQNKSKARR
jgi:rare lipoprotein A